MKFIVIASLLSLQLFGTAKQYYYSQQFCSGSSGAIRTWKLDVFPNKEYILTTETIKSQLSFNNHLIIERGIYRVADKYLILTNSDNNEITEFLITESSLIPLEISVDTFQNFSFQLDSLVLR